MVDEIKESMHHLGKKFGVCLFSIKIDERGTSAPSLATYSEHGWGSRQAQLVLNTNPYVFFFYFSTCILLATLQGR